MGSKLENLLKKSVKDSKITKFLHSNLYGTDFEIKFISPLDDLFEYSLTFSKEKTGDKILKNINNFCCITNALSDYLYSHSFIIAKNLRLFFTKAITNFFY